MQLRTKGKALFSALFQQVCIKKLQLSYFKDIDYGERIIYLNGFEVSDKIIKEELIKFSLS